MPNRLRGYRRLPLPFLVLLLLVAAPGRDAGAQPSHGVYEYVVERATGDVATVAMAIEQGFAARGWEVLARFEAGAPAGCKYRAQVVALVDRSNAVRAMSANRATAPFAVVDRVAVFEDESGVHVAVVNAESIYRTVFMDDSGHSDAARDHVARLRGVIEGAVEGRTSTREFGQTRTKGFIGKTMGVMAGGPFAQQIDDAAVVPGNDWKAVSARVKQGLAARGPKWGLHLVYTLEFPEQETTVFGTTGAALGGQSFNIVGAGADGARASYACPGLAHAAAYPLEVVVVREGNAVKIRMVDTMYRMKMYFEDAGKWAFMKNLGMPGSIRDELAVQIKAGLASK